MSWNVTKVARLEPPERVYEKAGIHNGRSPVPTTMLHCVSTRFSLSLASALIVARTSGFGTGCKREESSCNALTWTFNPKVPGSRPRRPAQAHDRPTGSQAHRFRPTRVCPLEVVVSGVKSA